MHTKRAGILYGIRYTRTLLREYSTELVTNIDLACAEEGTELGINESPVWEYGTELGCK